MIEELVGLSYHTYTDSGLISLKKALDIRHYPQIWTFRFSRCYSVNFF